MVEYKLFPGCMIQNRIPYLEKSAKVVLDELGVKYSSGEFGCCPNPVGIKFVDEKSWCALAARNLCVSEAEGKPLLSLCNGCNQSMSVANYELKHDEVLKANVNKILAKVGKEFKGTTTSHHFVNILHDEVGVEKIKSMVKKDLSSLKIAVHPGCHFMRPSHILKSDDPLKPTYLRDLVAATGATVVDYGQELLCCGNSVRNLEEETANKMLLDKMRGVKAAGADFLVVNCPSCFQQFDGEQRKLNKMEGLAEGEKFKVPIIYITELIALAMGKDPKELGMKFHVNKGKEALAKIQ